ncbi:MAG: LPS export ABC transporter periplasmic protein LptC [Cyanobacteria bacterium J06560_2]
MKSRWYRWLFVVAAIVVLTFGLRACFFDDGLADIEPQEAIDAELTLQSVTLEQPDEDGTLLWRLKAESVNYIPDTQRADLIQLEGEFFQAGEVIYTVEANEGEVLQNGNTLFLRGDLVATGRENELTLEGEKLKWLPKRDLLVMGEFEDSDEFEDAPASELTPDETTNLSTNDELTPDALQLLESTPPLTSDKAPVTGFNPQIKAVARIVKVNNKENRVELTGGVSAESKESPWLLFQSDSLLWFTDREIIEANQPLKVEQFDSDQYELVTDRLVGNKGQVELAENKVTLSEAVQLDSLTQPLTVKSKQAVWEVEAERVVMAQPVDIEQPERQITAQANRAELDLAEQVIVLAGDVKAVGKENDSRLAADSVTWQTTTQQIQAEGNVSYQQADDPDISIAGPRATGNLETGIVVIEGGESGEVVTEIIPDGF